MSLISVACWKLPNVQIPGQRNGHCATSALILSSIWNQKMEEGVGWCWIGTGWKEGGGGDDTERKEGKETRREEEETTEWRERWADELKRLEKKTSVHFCVWCFISSLVGLLQWVRGGGGVRVVEGGRGVRGGQRSSSCSGVSWLSAAVGWRLSLSMHGGALVFHAVQVLLLRHGQHRRQNLIVLPVRQTWTHTHAHRLINHMYQQLCVMSWTVLEEVVSRCVLHGCVQHTCVWVHSRNRRIIGPDIPHFSDYQYQWFFCQIVILKMQLWLWCNIPPTTLSDWWHVTITSLSTLSYLK